MKGNTHAAHTKTNGTNFFSPVCPIFISLDFIYMSSSFSSDPPQRKSKQQATKNIFIHSRTKLPANEPSSQSNVLSSSLPQSIYGLPPDRGAIVVPTSVATREMMANVLLKTVSEMYFGTEDPFAEILRNMDDRIDPVSGRYVSGLETFMRTEVLEPAQPASKKHERIAITALDMIACRFRKKEVIDDWTAKDVVMFELYMIESKGVFQPKKMNIGKTMEELLDFYEQVYCKSDSFHRITEETISNYGSTNEMDID